MPRNYQSIKNNPYLLPHNLYMRVLYIIRDYDRLKEEYHALDGYDSHVLTGMPGDGELSNPTEDKGIYRAAIFNELEVIEQALRIVPEEYRDPLKLNIMYGVQCPKTAHYNTWRRWKYRLVHEVAKNLKLI